MRTAPGAAGRGWWVPVLALAAALRAIYLLGGPLPIETRQTPIVGDAAYYTAAAVHLAARIPLQAAPFLPDHVRAAPWTDADTAVWLSSRGPGYVFFLSALYRSLAVDPWVARWVQALLGAATCAIVALAGQELASRRVGLVAGGLAALHPSLILFTGRLMPDTLALFLFWLAFLLLVRGVRLQSIPALIAAGLLSSLAALTRPTLLTTSPFQLAVVAIAGGAARRRRLALLAAFAAAIALPLVLWNGVSRALVDAPPTAGGFGLRVAAHLFLSATSSELRGWRGDTTPFAPEAELRFDLPAYRALALLNLVFYHLWFLDNLWREIPTWMHGLGRILSVLALGGLGLAVVRRRELALLVALAASFAAASAKYIEIRPVLVLIPAQLLLVGILVEGVWESIAGSPRPGRTALVAAAVAAVVIAIVCIHDPADLALLLPSLGPVALGRAGDLLIGFGALLSGGLLYRLTRGALGARRAALAGLLPAVAFLLLFAAYAGVASAPRWRAFEIDLAAVAEPVVQEIRLPRPLSDREVRAVHWFVDLRSEAELPPVRVGIDGEWLQPGRYAWRRASCSPNDGFAEKLAEVALCFWYTQGLSAFTGAFRGSPQWWAVAVSKELVVGRREVSLALGIAPGAPAGAHVLLGGAFGDEPPDRFSGPIVRAAGFLPATSLYRWHVEEDWRLWATQPLASVGTESRIAPPGEAARGRAARKQRLVAAAASRREAHLNIRLLVTTSDGRRVLY